MSENVRHEATMLSLFTRRASLAFAVAATVLGATAGYASAADNTSYYWSNNSNTGYCGQVDGGYVVAAQEILNTYGQYGGKIDNYWGSGSHNALVNFQSLRGLSADGCAGPQTWNNMQNLIRFHTTESCGRSDAFDIYRYPRDGRVSYFQRPLAGTRIWSVYSDANVGGPVLLREMYRFSDNLNTYC